MKLLVLLPLFVQWSSAGSLDPIQIPLSFQGGYTLANIKVGTPPVDYTVGLGISNIVGALMKTDLANLEFKKPYEISQSSSANLTKYGCSVNLDFNEQQTGSVVVDTLALNGITIPQYSFCNTNGAMVYYYNFSHVPLADGTLDLGRSYSTFITTVVPLLQNFRLPQFTLYYNQKAKLFDTLQQNAGQLTLGGVDTTNCGQFTYFNGLDETFWSVKVVSVKFNQKSFFMADKGRTRFYTFSFESDNICLPDAAVKTIRDYFYLSDDRSIVVNCDLAKKAPSISIHIQNGPEFEVGPSDYVEELTPGKCQLRVQTMTSFSDDVYGQFAEIALGIPFMRAHCVNFDADANKIGIAKVLAK